MSESLQPGEWRWECAVPCAPSQVSPTPAPFLSGVKGDLGPFGKVRPTGAECTAVTDAHCL